METERVYKVSLRKSRATWYYFTTNPRGGGFGSNNCGPRYIALARARSGIPIGSRYSIEINDRSLGTFERGAAGEP